MQLDFSIKGGDFLQAGMASSKLKRVLKQLNVEPKVIKKTVIALYEAEVNIVAHAYEGTIHITVDTDKVTIVLQDKGPGIPDVDLAMQEGYSTASAAVREMGFGAGMGLPNIKNNCDDLQIDSEVGEGTCLTITNQLKV